ncbi:MAG: serine hydrolase [Haliscomenobacter sp.]|uniref:serine hydrolase n=1 Tax=Haliscomenobacter sp. TaxID=2717303 RepID=UPI0029AE072A|nr:serine hydrolase [Haliscomenobacter sp.]MDX2072019.1 serine hydrolase [Haliscomenobacter sp.]
MRTILCLLLLFSLQSLFAQHIPTLQRRVPQLLDSALVPGVALAVINSKGVQHAQGFGLREANTQFKVDENTIFSAASLSKPVFAYVVLKLVDEGKFNLDKPLWEYFPYPDAAHDERYKRITARMVLSHTTGFPNWRNGQLNLLFDPPKRFSYSGEGFVYLQRVIEHLTQQSTDVLAQEKVFKPLAMSRSSFVWQKTFEDNFSYRHNRFGLPTGISKFDQANTAYSLQTSAADYGKFLVALLNGKGLKPASVKQLFAPQVRTGQKFRDTLQASKSIAWGLGLGLQIGENDEGFWHWGDNGDFKCFFFVSRTQKKGLVYFSNGSNGLNFAASLTRLVVDVPMPSMSEFLAYTDYKTPLFQLGIQILKRDVISAVEPYLSGGKIGFSADELRGLSSDLLRANQANKAQDLLEWSIKQYPDSKSLLKTYSLSLLQMGERDKARPVLGKYLQLDPGDPQISHLFKQLNEVPSGKVVLRSKAFAKAKMVTIAGSFNNWQSFYTLANRENEEWVVRLDLAPGKYTYKFVVDGNWELDPDNFEKEDDGNGNTNSVLIVK